MAEGQRKERRVQVGIAMTRFERYRAIYEQGHRPINCTQATTLSGQPVLLAEIGMSEEDELCVYIWCRTCHRAHPITIAQIFGQLREMAMQEHTLAEQVRGAYIETLTEALAAMPAREPADTPR